MTRRRVCQVNTERKNIRFVAACGQEPICGMEPLVDVTGLPRLYSKQPPERGWEAVGVSPMGAEEPGSGGSRGKPQTSE